MYFYVQGGLYVCVIRYVHACGHAFPTRQHSRTCVQVLQLDELKMMTSASKETSAPAGPPPVQGPTVTSTSPSAVLGVWHPETCWTRRSSQNSAQCVQTGNLSNGLAALQTKRRSRCTSGENGRVSFLHRC